MRIPTRLRVWTQSDPVGDGGDERDGGCEVAGEAVVAGRDAAEVLEPTEHALDGVARAVSACVEGMRVTAGGIVGNYDEGAGASGLFAQGARIVALVPQEHAARRRQAQIEGQSFQRQPERSTCTMPLMTRRSSTRRAPGWLLGSNGSIADQAASSSQYSTAIVAIQAVTLSLNQISEPDS